MPPIIPEHVTAAWLAGEPAYGNAAWLDAYANCLGKLRSGISMNDAYSAGLKAYERQSLINPKLAALGDVMLGPL